MLKTFTFVKFKPVSLKLFFKQKGGILYMKLTEKEMYDDYCKNYKKLTADPRSRVMSHPGEFYQEPFKMFGNLYYVGDKFVSAHIVDTGDGLILMDCCNTGQGGALVNAIWAAGFNPANIKWLILSHGHLDHFGQAVFFRDMYGCKIYMSEPDARMFKEQPELSFIQHSSSLFDTLFEPDEIIYDGDVLEFGNTKIRYTMVPGHTMGVLACFFDITDGKETKRAGYFGGFGFNTLQKDYLLEIGDTEYKMRDLYLQSIDKVINEHVDVFVSNHPINGSILEKYAYQKEHPNENPFVDDTVWKSYLGEKRDALLEFMADPKQN